MKAKIIVTLKEGVLDPQGAAIRRALGKLGHDQVHQVRQGKYFELEFEEAAGEEEVRRRAEQIAQKVLSNPIIERFEIEEIL
ncbi:MAG: phosphoribosylformylglycinamidine synthase subunit PurS [Acidobacteriota bacterium]